MRRKLLLDTNVLLDAAMAERPEHPWALALFDEFAYGGATGLIASLSLKDVYYVLAKYAGEESARGFVLALLDVLDIANVDAATCRMAALSDEPDFEDGIVRACAEAARADFIISRDGKAFRKSTVRRLSPREYLKLFTDGEELSLP